MNPCRNPNIETKLLPDGHVVLFAPETDWAHTLSPLGGITWEFCDGAHSVDDIASLVAETAGLPSADSLKSEISKLVEELTESGLLTDNNSSVKANSVV